MMMQRALCPILVGRDRELSELEDALLAANRGSGNLTLLAAEAGMGKTRLVSELSHRAAKLGMVVMQGSCSEADLSLPYLPFVEALGNYLTPDVLQETGPALGGARAELAHVFPQFADASAAAGSGDPAQARTRLFEAVALLLSVPAARSGLLLVIEDIHWADAATRDLLDHLARRLLHMRAMVLVSYRSDEIDRTHPLRPHLQAWRRSEAAGSVTLDPLPPAGVGAMIAAIFDEKSVGDAFIEFMHHRSEGVPFVLEEMLKEALDRGDIFRSESGWDRRAIEDLHIPETVKDMIILRVGRLDPTHPPILQVAAVLGRAFTYNLLERVSGAPVDAVQATLEEAIRHQLVEEVPGGKPGTYRWRHALTQEVIYDELILPRRQKIHRRIAETLRDDPKTRSVELAHHLLGSGDFTDAVPLCLRAADEAMGAFAFGEAASLYERALPFVEPPGHAELVCKIGRAYVHDLKSARGIALLQEGIPALESAGRDVEAAGYRVHLSRAYWELRRSDAANEEIQRALPVLERAGPSAQLALAYVRLAGYTLFEFDVDASGEAAQRAIDIATEAGADLERVWAQTFLPFWMIHRGRLDEGFAALAAAADEAARLSFDHIVGNAGWNDVWTRAAMGMSGFVPSLQLLTTLSATSQGRLSFASALSYTQRIAGDLRLALDGCKVWEVGARETGFSKYAWRERVHRSDVLLDLGRYDDARAALPAIEERTELQDIVYDASAQIRFRLTRGRTGEAVALAEEVSANLKALGLFRPTVAIAAHAFIAAGRFDDATSLIAAAWARTCPYGTCFLEEAAAALALATGDHAAAETHARAAETDAGASGYRLVELQARVRLADALLCGGRRSEGEPLLIETASAAAAIEFGWALDLTRTVAERNGLTLDSSIPDTAAVPMGERMVSVLFADVRNYAAQTRASAPSEMIDRLTSLHRWAAAEVARAGGVIDKFAGDAVMATFNVSGATVDHCLHALQAAMGLRDKALLLDMPVGVGIAVGPAMVGHSVAGANLTVTGETTNLAARLQAAAAGGEIILSDEAHRRTAAWLAERGVHAHQEAFTLKGFSEPQIAHRVRPAARQAIA